MGCELQIIAAFSAFLPLLFQLQYSMSSSTSALISGGIVVVGAGVCLVPAPRQYKRVSRLHDAPARCSHCTAGRYRTAPLVLVSHFHRHRERADCRCCRRCGCAAAGTVVGGWITGRWKFTGVQMATMTAVASGTSIFAMLVLLLRCDTPDVAGITVG